MNTLNLFIFIDALGWEILSKRSFLNDECQFRIKTETVLGYSSTAVPTILTGEWPETHGHMSFFYYSPSTSPFKALHLMNYFPGDFLNRGRVRTKLSDVFRRIRGYTGYFQLYEVPFQYLPYLDYIEKKDIYEPGGLDGEQTRTIFQRLDEYGARWARSDWRATEEKNLEAAKQRIRKSDVDVLYLYWPKLDGLLHVHGLESPLIDARIAWYERSIRELLDNATQSGYKTVNLLVFSDHGMTPTTNCDSIWNDLNSLGLTIGVDWFPIYDSTMARFHFLNDSAERTVRDALAQRKGGRILDAETLKSLHSSYTNNRYGDLIWLSDPGNLIAPSYMGKKPLAGMHGYHPADQDSLGMFISNIDPGIEINNIRDINFAMRHIAQCAIGVPASVNSEAIN